MVRAEPPGDSQADGEAVATGFEPRSLRLRVLSLVDVATDQGGAERFAIALATHLPANRFESWICATRSVEPQVIGTLRSAGVRHIALERRGKWDVLRLLRLVRLLRRERFDVLHAHKFGSNLWGTLIGRACRVPVIIAHEHTWSYQGDPLRAWLDGRVIGRLATRFIAVSKADQERMVSVEHVPRGKIVVIPASVYISRPGSSGPDLRTELGLASDTPLVVVVAVLRPQKALSVLLEAMLEIRNRGLDAHLVIAGDGACREPLEQHTRDLGLQDAVHFLGRRSDIDAILRCADVAALSSDYEGTPVFIGECVVNRVPVVSTAVGGIPEILEDGRTALLVPPRDPTALATAIHRLLADPSERERMASTAATELARLTIDAVAERVGRLYEDLVG
ncbi:MAG: glycosyltransferase family 4 protein [Solirubrobacteraceae bacterium]